MNAAKDLITTVATVATLANYAAKQKETSQHKKCKRKLRSSSTKLLCQEVTRDTVLVLFPQGGLKEMDLTLMKLN